MTIYNFGSGPAMLPREVMQQVHEEWFNWQGSGLSAVEWSHRAAKFEPMIHQTKTLIAQLLSIPKNYKVLFFQGGASLMWSVIPMNIAWGKSAGFVTSGLWSEKALKEAGKYCQTEEIASALHEGKFSDIVPVQDWHLNPAHCYTHYCSNETIQGIQYPNTTDSPEIGDWQGPPLVADMSSDIFSRPIDVSRYGAIYAGAQKNAGIAGLTILILREDWLDIAHDHRRFIPNTLHFKTVEENLSLLNTPCTFAIYVCNLVLQWTLAQGGVQAMATINREKAQRLYDYFDQSSFYATQVAKRARSQMNVTFNLRDPSLLGKWLEGAEKAGLYQLKGHRLQGGLRASIYNAMPQEGISALLNYADTFAKQHG